jgi:hypothetical protein
MKKYSIYFALLAFAAILAILAACGSDEIAELPENYATVKDMLVGQNGFIVVCQDNPTREGCPQNPSSSSSDFEVPSYGSSSSDEPYYESSSSNNEIDPPSSAYQSSSSVQTNQSSSSQTVTPPASSSSVDPNAYVVHDFTCAWDPSTVVSGKNATVKIALNSLDDVADVECTKKVFLPIKNIAGNRQAEYELVPGNSYLVKFGHVMEPASGNRNAVKFPDEPASLSSASYSELIGRVMCSGNGKPQGEKELPCSALTITKPPPASANKSVAFTNAYTYSSSSIFYLNETPQYTTDLVLTQNDAAADCGSIVYTDSWGGSHVSTTGNITVTAKCEDSGQILSTATASVVPDPSLSGTCVWDTKNNTFGGGVSAKVTTAPTIQNLYGRTCVGPSFFVGGTQKQTVTAGLTVDTWDGNSSQTMSGITIGATCGSISTATISCPNITVKDPNAMCEYLTTWCNGITLANIKTANVTSDPPIGQAGGDQCFFATTITSIGNAVDATVNGKTIGSGGKCGNTGWGQPTCASALSTAGVEATDGGYYIYVPSAGNWTGQDVRLTNSYAPNLHPNCEAQK